MRILDVNAGEVRVVAVSPDGRFIAVDTEQTFGVFHWATGEAERHWNVEAPCTQIAFAPDGNWMARGQRGLALRLHFLDASTDDRTLFAPHAGGVAIAPNGRMLVTPYADQASSVAGKASSVRLACWSLPKLQSTSGFDYWSPFQKLAFSPNGDYLAGIWPGVLQSWRLVAAEFELRYAKSGGLDYRYSPPARSVFGSTGFVSFTRDSGTCAFGWRDDFHVLDISTGTSRYLRRVEASFRDAAFTGSGQHFATVDDEGLLKLWDVKSWHVVREYDWQCGPLTCITFTADGSAGVCGTADGRLVQFDVDE